MRLDFGERQSAIISRQFIKNTVVVGEGPRVKPADVQGTRGGKTGRECQRARSFQDAVDIDVGDAGGTVAHDGNMMPEAVGHNRRAPDIKRCVALQMELNLPDVWEGTIDAHPPIDTGISSSDDHFRLGTGDRFLHPEFDSEVLRRAPVESAANRSVNSVRASRTTEHKRTSNSAGRRSRTSSACSAGDADSVLIRLSGLAELPVMRHTCRTLRLNRRLTEQENREDNQKNHLPVSRRESPDISMQPHVNLQMYGIESYFAFVSN